MRRQGGPTMPDVPIIDAHVHLWDPDHLRLSWLDGNARLNRRFGLPEFRAATAGLAVAGLVYLETDVDHAYSFLEASWAAGLAAQDSLIKGIVPFAPLEYGERARA